MGKRQSYGMLVLLKLAQETIHLTIVTDFNNLCKDKTLAMCLESSRTNAS